MKKACQVNYAAVVCIRTNRVVGYLVDAPKTLEAIPVAWWYTATGEAVDPVEFKVSHSAEDIKTAYYADRVMFHKKSSTYHFHSDRPVGTRPGQ